MITLNEAFAALAELTKPGHTYTTQQSMDLADHALIDVTSDSKRASTHKYNWSTRETHCHKAIAYVKKSRCISYCSAQPPQPSIAFEKMI